MAMAMVQLEEAGVDNYILDLRDNPVSGADRAAALRRRTA